MYVATISTYDEAKQYLVKHLYAGDAAAMDRVSTHVLASSCSGIVASLVSHTFSTLEQRMVQNVIEHLSEDQKCKRM